jgi:hypothetical protein
VTLSQAGLEEADHNNAPAPSFVIVTVCGSGLLPPPWATKLNWDSDREITGPISTMVNDQVTELVEPALLLATTRQ